MTANTQHPHPIADSPSERVRRQPLVVALAITSTYLVAEVIGGIVTGSLALLADAAHMATDAAALALSLFAIWLARRPATLGRSFGFLRAEVLAALLNAASLIVISLYIFWEAYQRIGEPPEVDSGPMLAVAVGGLLANVVSAWVLMRGGGHEDNLNVRGALLHVIGDLLGSVGAIVAAIIMLLTGWYLADPLLSAGIGLLILWSSWRLLRESVEVLLEATPVGIDPEAVRDAMARVNGVASVHDLHIWTVTSGLVALSSHVEITGQREWHDTLIDLSRVLNERFGIVHVTLQPEQQNALPDSFRDCSFESLEGRAACLAALPTDVRQAHGNHAHSH